MTLHLIALGANLGPVPAADAARIRRAARRLAAGARSAQLSRLYATPAWPPGLGPPFVNAVVAMHSPVAPERLLERLHAMERSAGRLRVARWGVRGLDLDLLASGAMVRPSAAGQAAWRDLMPSRQAHEAPDDLILPHPRLQDRAFVLEPLCDVAPGWRHPLTGRTASAMRDALPAAARAGIRPIASAS
jgi:2-amino-4-hydroxy-6-hydroxymethyldihydropteridine diphosphokinase